MSDKNIQKGFAVIFITLFVIAIMLSILASIVIFTVGGQKISRDIIKSTQAYYTAESGAEDALLRLAKKMTWSSPYTLSVGGDSAAIEISGVIGGARTISSQGSVSGRVRNVQAVYQISTQEVAFYFGAQVGNGGVEMGNNAKIDGNIFSGGSVIAPTGTGIVTGSVTVANNGNKIKNLSVGGNATVHTCENSTITGTLTYVSGGSLTNCTVGGATQTRPNEITPQDLPISQSQIDSWKSDAASGGILTGDYSLSGSHAEASLGPKQIGTASQPKNLTINNGATLKITGTIYVTGDVLFDNNAIIKLDSASYGSNSGVIIADGKIIVDNNAELSGSGQTGSYLMILSTNNSLDPDNPAIKLNNSAEGAIFYAGSGLIYLNNNMKAREVTAYKLQLNNSAVVEYESGLESATFTSGPGGSWEVASWGEVQ